MTVKQRQEFRIRLQRRVRRKAEKMLEAAESEKTTEVVSFLEVYLNNCIYLFNCISNLINCIHHLFNCIHHLINFISLFDYLYFSFN